MRNGTCTAKELDVLTKGEVKIQIVSLSTPLDLNLVNSIKDKSNIKIDHFFVDNDKTVKSADNNDARTNGSKTHLFSAQRTGINISSSGNFKQYHLKDELLKDWNVKSYNSLVEWGAKGSWEKEWGFAGGGITVGHFIPI